MKFGATILWAISIVLSLVFGGCAEAASASTPESDMAIRIAEMRSEIDRLQNQIESQKASARLKLEGLASQKSEVELAITRETQKRDELERKLRKHREDVAKSTESARTLRPILKSALDDLHAYVNASLPFKKGERLAEVETLRKSLQDEDTKPTRLLAKTWALVEDELRLAHENTLSRQTITVAGEEKLVETARIGMSMMYYRTPSGEVGKSVRTGEGWEFRNLSANADAKMINTLFDSFRKGIRVGQFVLPNALPNVALAGSTLKQ